MNNKQFEIGASEQPLDIIKETCGFAGIFKQIGVIGDSLASGEFESHDENGNIVYTDMYEYSWPAVLERITGTKYNNYSRGGMTAREYVQSWADTNGFWQWNQAYIIALGNNDSFVFGHPLGSVKDVNADCPQDNGDTFFGNMGKIVSKLKTIEPNARVFVVTPQLRGEACDNDIRYIASELAKLCDMFEFTYLLDMTAHGFSIYAVSFIFAGIAIFGSAFFTALNDGLTSAVISFLRTLLFECASVMILPLILGLNGIWCSIVVAEFMAVVVTLIFLVVKRKKYGYW